MANGPVTFAGGFARASQRNRALGIEEERLDIQRQEQQRLLDTEAQERRNQFLDGFTNSFDEIVKMSQEDPILGKSDVPLKLAGDIRSRIDALEASNAASPEEIAILRAKSAESIELLNFLRDKPTPVQQEILEAEEIIGGPLTAGQIATKLGIDPKGSLAQAATFINQQREAEGKEPLTSRQIEGMFRAQQAGMTIQVQPDGSILVGQEGDVETAEPGAATTQPSPQAGAVTGALPSGLRIGGTTADEIRAAQSVIQTGNQIIDHLIEQGQENPEIFGFTGSARRVGQRARGLAKDAAATGLSVIGFDAQSGFEALEKTISSDITDENVKKSLRPSSPGELEVFQKILQYSTARALQPEGKLLASTVEAAGTMTALTGFKASQEVMDALVALKLTNDSALSSLERRFQQGVSGTTSVPLASPVEERETPPETRPEKPKKLRFNPETGQVEPVQ